MAFKKHNPGCTGEPADCGCTECLFCRDDFNRDDETLDAGWDVRSGTLEILDHELTTEETDALAVCATAHPDSSPSMVARVKIQSDKAGDRLRLVIAYDDDDNYLFGELEVAADCEGQLRLYQRLAGIDSQLGSSVPIPAAVLNEFHTLRLCYQDGTGSGSGSGSGSSVGTLCAIVTTSDDQISQASREVDSFGSKAGLGTGTIGGTARFDDYRSSRLTDVDNPDCSDCSCDECTIHDDDFTRETLPSDYGCRWQKLAGGDIGINADGELETTASDVLLASSSKHPRDTAAAIVTATVRSDTAGDKIRLIADLVDVDNYHFAELEVASGSGTLRLYKRDAGSDTLLEELSLTINTLDVALSMRLCVLLDSIDARVGLAGIAAGSALHDGASAGLATGSIGGTIKFDDFSFSRHKTEEDPDCSDCITIGSECGQCEDANGNPSVPTQMKVVIAGVENALCDDCLEAINGTFIFNISDLLGPPSPGIACIWTIEVPWECGAGEFASLQGQVILGGIGITVTWFVQFGDNYFFSGIIDAESPIDCALLKDVPLPLSQDFIQGKCSAANATCHVSAL